MKKKILSIGEIIWDVYPEKKTIGGAPMNFAAHAVRCGADCFLISAIGNDELGENAIRELRDFGVNCEFIKRNEKSTGQCIVTLDEKAIPHYNVLSDAAYDYISLEDSDYDKINQEHFDAFYFGTLVQRNLTSRNAVSDLINKCRFPNIVCDVNLRPNCYDVESVQICLNHATILKVSMEEEPILRLFGGYAPKSESPKSVAVALCEKYSQLEIVILTLGKEGSYAYIAKDQKEYRQKAIGDSVVSTVGAGDSFTAAWLISYLDQKPMELCMEKAAEISGFVVAHTEAIPFYCSQDFDN